MRHKWILITLLAFGVIFASCAQAEIPATVPPTDTPVAIAVQPSETSLPTETEEPTIELATDEPTKTSRPTKTLPPTITQTNTPDPAIPTATATHIPPTPTIEGWQPTSDEVGLIKNRKWFVFADKETGQIGGFNIDGTGLTWYDLPPMKALSSCVRCRVSVSNNFIAYITINETDNSIDLVIAKFPQGQLISQIPIAPIGYAEDNIEYFLMDSLGKMSWSPDGQYLAIAAMPNRYYTDLYLYKKGTSYLDKISNEDSYVNRIYWSSNGQTIHYQSIDFPRVDDGSDSIESFQWTYDMPTDSIQFLKSYTYWDAFGGGCAGDGTIYTEITNDKETTKILINNGGKYDLGYGIYIQNLEDDEPRFLLPAGRHYDTYRWIETAKKFVVGNEIELVVISEDGNIDLRIPNYDTTPYSWFVLNLSYDETQAALISSSGLLEIYDLNDGFHKTWTVPEPVVVSRIYWRPDGKGLIIEELGHVYYVDLQRQEVNLILYDGGDRFDMEYGFWMSQEP